MGMDDFDFPDAGDADMMQGLMGAMGFGGGMQVGQLFAGRPELGKKFARLDALNAATSFAALLTVPDLQANATRLEALVQWAIARGDGTQKITDKLVSAAFDHLGEGMCGMMEDPSEDVMVGTVRSRWGNFSILEGLWEGSAFYLQRFVDLVGQIPAGTGHEAMQSSVRALLGLSDLLCARVKLARHELGAEMPADRLPSRKLSAWLLRRRHLRFSPSELAAAGIDARHLEPFLFDMKRKASLFGEGIGSSTLERKPLVRRGDYIYLVLPTAVSSAIRYFVIAELEEGGLLDTCRRALARIYADLIASTPLLGGRRSPGLAFEHLPEGSFAEAISEFDRGRYLHFLFFTDGLETVSETGLSGMNPASMVLGEPLERRIREARKRAGEREGFRGGVTLVVGCGIGRGEAIAFGEEEVLDWHVEFCSAYDLDTLSFTPKFGPLAFWRLLEARERAGELKFHVRNLNGLINLVAWARDHDGHILPHGSIPAELGDGREAYFNIDQSRQRMLRHQIMCEQDVRVERFLDGQWVRVRRDRSSPFRDDDTAPLYGSEDLGPSGLPMLLYRAPKRAWWADVSCPADEHGLASYDQWRMTAVWLQRAAPHLDDLEGLPPGPVLVEVEFAAMTSAPEDVPPPQSYALALATIAVEARPSEGRILLRVGEGFRDALYSPENIAERALVTRLVEGAAVLAGAADPAALGRTLTPRIATNPHARQGHAIVVHGFRDQVRGDLQGRVAVIEREDDAFTRLGLCWNVRDRSAGNRLDTKDDCLSFLNALVRYAEDDLIADLGKYSRAALLESLLRNHERAIAERDHWKRTTAALIGLHGATEDTYGLIRDHEFKLNAVFQATRVLVEMAVCECPLDGGMNPGTLDLGLLMAKAGLIFEMGGWSDAIRWDLMAPDLRLTPLGDVHANFDFHDEVVMPHAQITAGNRITDDAESYAENLEDRPPQASVEHRIEADFAEAWTEQFGASIDQTRVFIDFIENLGVTAQKAVLRLPRSRFSGVSAAGQALDDAITARLMDALTLVTRPRWRDIPDGFDAKDIHPWRFRRRLSMLRRPLLQIDEGADPTIIVSPGMIRDGFFYIMSNLYRGDFADQQLSPKMRRWKARRADERGAAFSQDAAAALRAAGWETATEVALTKLLGQGFGRNYGDVDVLAWRPDGRVLAIECKDVQYRKTYGEIAEQLADFRGEMRSNGKPDYLLKHLHRMEKIGEHLEAVATFTGLASVSAVESHLMFRNPVPMEFALAKMAEKVKVSRFDRISDI